MRALFLCSVVNKSSLFCVPDDVTISQRVLVSMLFLSLWAFWRKDAIRAYQFPLLGSLELFANSNESFAGAVASSRSSSDPTGWDSILAV